MEIHLERKQVLSLPHTTTEPNMKSLTENMNNKHIKLFNPKATELTNLIQTDIGRPISDTVSNVKYDVPVEDAKKVLETLSFKIADVQSKKGHWYQVRLVPYPTLKNMIDGLVITFLNIDAQKQVEEKVKQLTKGKHAQ